MQRILANPETTQMMDGEANIIIEIEELEKQLGIVVDDQSTTHLHWFGIQTVQELVTTRPTDYEWLEEEKPEYTHCHKKLEDLLELFVKHGRHPAAYILERLLDKEDIYEYGEYYEESSDDYE